MIHVYGTSHVSRDSIELIDEKIEEHQPDIVALELDMTRLNALLKDEERKGGPLFIRCIKAFQDYFGKQTGVMPGEEMLHAYFKAGDIGAEVGLIDQDIFTTVQKLRRVRRKEKVKAVFHLMASFFLKGSFNVEEIPEEEFVDELLKEMEIKFPDMYRVLVEERNRYMSEALRQLQEQNPDEEILAFVGAAHRKEIERALKDF